MDLSEMELGFMPGLWLMKKEQQYYVAQALMMATSLT